MILFTKKLQQLNALNKGPGLMDSITVSELEDVMPSKTDPRLKKNPDVTLFMSYDFYPLDNPHFHKPMLYGFKQSKYNSNKNIKHTFSKLTKLF